MSIHPAAVVSPQAVIHSGVEIGPFCVVEAGAVIGQNCQLMSGAVVKSGCTIGRDVVIHEGVVVGGTAQHLAPPEAPGRVLIGERCILRENATVHRSMYTAGTTRIGSDCYLMSGAHVGHDSQVGNHVILTNNVLLGGHVHVGDRACLGGSVAVHQHCRVGRLAMIGGCARIVQDVPPFVLTDGASGLIVGLNRVGMRRAGLDREQQAQLKGAYRLIYRRGLTFQDAIEALEAEFPVGPAAEFAPFFRDSKRGFVQERRSPPRTSIRLHPAADEESVETKRLAG
ncbi:MAG: acyl-ACP--UDP-N-acetylglucosamine O-acyltransferase [Planctomycetales bacterium]|nr:acyl-ACP--UDP-N-acetylglucosamine O-acyltransferase [Planctomycetales bacterium]